MGDSHTLPTPDLRFSADLLAALPVPLVVTRREDGRILHANEPMAAIVGCAPGDLIGRVSTEFYQPEDRVQLLEALAGGSVDDARVNVRGQRGRRRRCRVWIRPAETRGQACLVSVFEDVTERLREIDVRAAAARVGEAVWRMTDPKDVQDVIRTIAAELESLGVPFSRCDVNIIDEASAPPAVHINIIDGEGFSTVEAQGPGVEIITDFWREGRPVYRPDLLREDRWQELQHIVPLAGRGTVRSVVDVPFSHGTISLNSDQPEAFSDLDLELLERLAGVLSDGFRRLVDLRHLADQRHHLEQARRLEALGQLAGGVAHDFNNLLTVIIGHTQLLERRLEAGHAGLAHLERVQTACDSAAAMVRQLLACGRRQSTAPQILDVAGALGDARQLLERLLPANIELHTRLPEEPCAIEIDPAQLEQIVVNLVANARDAMPAGGRIDLQASSAFMDQAWASAHPGARAGEHLILEVADTGQGMDSETLDRIFEPFFTTKGSSGTGLGLATVYGIVKQSGGTIWARSEPNLGTTFRVYLPLAATPAAGATGADPKPAADLVPGSGLVLLVEDEPEVRRLSAQALRDCGYQVRTADSGEQAMLWLRDHEGGVDVLITDLMLPGVDGLAVAEAVTARSPDTRVIFISGYAGGALCERDRLGPGGTFLAKPFTPAMLSTAVAAVLGEAS